MAEPRRLPDGRVARPCCVCRHSAAVACRECCRALALFAENHGEWLSCINHHPQQVNDCKMCHLETAIYCGTCLLVEALAHRHLVRGPLAGVTERGWAVPREPAPEDPRHGS